MKTELSFTHKKVLFVCGRICSGKDTFCKQLALHEHVVVSDIVKRITGEISRAKLQDTAELDTQIAEALLEKIHSSGPVAIDGIRQPSILQYLMDNLKPEDYEIIWLRVPPEERKRRYHNRSAQKDFSQSFEAAENLDVKLGVAQLHSMCFYELGATIIKNYD